LLNLVNKSVISAIFKRFNVGGSNLNKLTFHSQFFVLVHYYWNFFLYCRSKYGTFVTVRYYRHWKVTRRQYSVSMPMKKWRSCIPDPPIRY